MKVRVILEFEQKPFGSEMRIVKVEPNPEKIPEHLKDMIYDDYGIDVDMHQTKD